MACKQSSPKRRPKKKFVARFKNKGEIAQFIGAKLERIEGACMPIDPDAVNTLELVMREAYASLISGTATIQDAATLGTEISIGMRLCEVDFAGSKEHLHIAIAARDAMESCGNRYKRTGKWGLSGPEMQTLLNFIDLRAAQYSHEDNRVGIERAAQDDVRAAIDRGDVIRFTANEAVPA